jgi:hypothetical protein
VWLNRRKAFEPDAGGWKCHSGPALAQNVTSGESRNKLAWGEIKANIEYAGE